MDNGTKEEVGGATLGRKSNAFRRKSARGAGTKATPCALTNAAKEIALLATVKTAAHRRAGLKPNSLEPPDSHQREFLAQPSNKQSNQSMKTTTSNNIKTRVAAKMRLGLLLTTSIATLACLPASAEDHFRGNGRDDEQTHYRQIDLVSDIRDVAQIQDTNLVNSWGIAFGATGPFWVGDNGTGLATLYNVTNDALGTPKVSKNPLEVTIPGAGNVTGLVKNNTTAFNGDAFVFASEDGTISGWRGALGTKAEILATRNGGVYKGITIAIPTAGPVLLAANFNEGTLDEYNSAGQLIGQFVDRRAPAGYAPFNVLNVAGTVFVTFAKQDDFHQLDEGRGHGLIDTFNVQDNSFHRFATGTDAGGNIREMNSPWGVTLAPSTFGSHANQFLVGNFGSGTIMTFDAHGIFHGLLKGTEECPVTIDGLWSLTFGAAGTAGVPTDLYFTAGPNSEAHGLFGVIQKEIEDRGNHRDDSQSENRGPRY